MENRFYLFCLSLFTKTASAKLANESASRVTSTLPQPAPACPGDHAQEGGNAVHPWMEVSSACRHGGLSVPSLPWIPLPSQPTEGPQWRCSDESESWLLECFRTPAWFRYLSSAHCQDTRMVKLPSKGLTVQPKSRRQQYITHTQSTRPQRGGAGWGARRGLVRRLNLGALGSGIRHRARTTGDSFQSHSGGHALGHSHNFLYQSIQSSGSWSGQGESWTLRIG